MVGVFCCCSGSNVYTPLINNLEINNLFRDKNREEGVGITDFINKIVYILKGDLYWVKISIQKVGLMEPVEL